MPSGAFVDVILPLPLPETFTYGVPPEWMSRVTPGIRVVVQFGQQKVYAGIVLRSHDNPPANYQVKPILDILDDAPVVTSRQFRLWQWISDYYLCTRGEVMAAALPTALRLQSESVIERNEDFTGDPSLLTDREYLIYEALELHQRLTLLEVSKILSLKHVMPVLRNMLEKQVVIIREELEERYKPRMVTLVSLSEEYAANDERMAELMDNLEGKSPRQLDLLLAYLQLAREEGFSEVPRTLLLKRSGVSSSILATLERKKVFALIQRPENRIVPYSGTSISAFQLNPHQQTAMAGIRLAFSEGKVTLLHGVTSSGKTAVYIELIREQIKEGRQVLYLLPEIALTTQLIGRLQQHFGDDLLVYHSRFNEQERVEIWNMVLENNLGGIGSRGKVVIGARSAVFLPFERLGLVIVDEEHDASYKQEDPSPRYNARDLAVVMGGFHDAHVLLGSATPGLETYFNALTGKYALVSLDRRHAGLEMPRVDLVDMKEARKRRLVNGQFSNLLVERIKEELDAGQQVILFQNRRGFSPFIECALCSWTPRCVNCDVAMTYHKRKEELRCHYCGYVRDVPSNCAACGDQDLKMRGYGTERVEEELQVMLPEARVARLDYDTTRSKSAYRRVISSFEQGEVDILVGTQMVTKGLDFDRVSLVGILNADAILHFPEFRAHERGFQLLAQVSGRAGRKGKGQVLVQTYQTDNAVLKFVLNHDYQGFYFHELNERHRFNYPPYFRLIEIRLKHRDEKRLESMSSALSSTLRSVFGKRVLGPTVPYVSRIRNLYHRNILLKLEKTLSVVEVKQKLQQSLEIFRKSPDNRQLIIQIDVDPV